MRSKLILLQKSKFLLTAFLFVLSTFLFLLFFDKNFLYRDDLICCFLPYSKLQFETLIHELQIPFMNYYQYLGNPVLPHAQTGVLFPPRYIFYFLTSLFSMETFSPAIEIIFFSLLGGAGIYSLLRALKVRPEIASLIAFSYATNGFLMQLAPTWIYVAGYYGLTPWLFLADFKLTKNNKFFAISAAIRALIFYLGHTNFFVYLVLFEFAFIFLYRTKTRNILKYLFSLIITSIISLPLLLPIIVGFSATSRVVDFQEQFYGFSELKNILAGTIMPSQIANIANEPATIYFNAAFFLLPLALWKSRWLSRSFIFTMAVFILLAPENILSVVLHLFLVAAIFTAYLAKKNRLMWVFVILSLSGILLSTGPNSVLSYLFYPFIKFFRWPFKWFFLVQFTLSVFLGLFLNKKVPQLGYKKVVLLLFCLVFISIATYISNVRDYSTGFSSNNESAEVYKSIDRNYRVTAFGDSSVAGEASQLLGGNIPTKYKLIALGGFDAVVAKQKEDLINLNTYSLYENSEDLANHLNIFQTYGVKNILVSQIFFKENLAIFGSDFEKVAEDQKIVLLNYKKAMPLVFNDQLNALPFEIKGNNIMVDLATSSPQESQRITLAWMRLDDNWQASVGNQELPVYSDEKDRVSIEVPAGHKTLTVQYRDKQFYIGLFVSIFLILSLIAGRAFSTFTFAKNAWSKTKSNFYYFLPTLPKMQLTNISLLCLAIFTLAVLFFSFSKSLNSIFLNLNPDLRNRITGTRLLLAQKDPYFYVWEPTDPIEWLDPTANPEQVVSRLTVPPTLLLFHIPLANIPYAHTMLIWLAVEWLTYLGLALIIIYHVKKFMYKAITFVFFGLFSLSHHWLTHIGFGQIHFLYMALSVVFLIALTKYKNRKILFFVGFFLGMLFATRPQYAALLIPLLMVNLRKKFFIYVAVGAATLFLISTLVFSSASWQNYISAMKIQANITYTKDLLPLSLNTYYPKEVDGLTFVRNSRQGYATNYETSTKGVMKDMFYANVPTWVSGLLGFSIIAFIFYRLRTKDGLIPLNNISALTTIGLLCVIAADLATPAPRYSYYNVLLLPPLLFMFLNIKSTTWSSFLSSTVAVTMFSSFSDTPFNVVSFYCLYFLLIYLSTSHVPHYSKEIT